ncbi:MAG: SpoIIE family protein phosphatase [Chloroflexi bacterium]|nr:SpoIIE family protein phosphatase [Chloroflexota bacterium]MCC6894387.1 SpoIIE family protein phosphatase [Anaerolineae bacterium]
MTAPTLSTKLTLDHLTTLYQISMTMNSSLQFDEALANVIDAMMLATKAERGVLMGFDEETGALRLLGARGVAGEQLVKEEAYSTTIVNQVVSTRQPLLTNNAMFDDRITPGQSIIMRGLRAILCAPMMAQDRLVGVVYVDTSMRSGAFTEADRDLLSAIANQAGITLENSRLYTVAVEKGRLEHELNLAREIQQGLLPRRKPELPGYEVEAVWQSAREMAGDFYDYFTLNEQSFGVVIADVSDKGAPSALFMAVARSMIRSYAYAGLPPRETLSQTNDLILDDAESGMFVTVYHSVFFKDGRSININAGHNPPVLYRAASRTASLMPQGGRAIGWFPSNPLSEVQLQLEPGDVIVYYTDGLTDAENPNGENFGEARLCRVIEEAGTGSAAEILQYILRAVDQFGQGIVPFDDLTLMVVRYVG